MRVSSRVVTITREYPRPCLHEIANPVLGFLTLAMWSKTQICYQFTVPDQPCSKIMTNQLHADRYRAGSVIMGCPSCGTPRASFPALISVLYPQRSLHPDVRPYNTSWLLRCDCSLFMQCLHMERCELPVSNPW